MPDLAAGTRVIGSAVEVSGFRADASASAGAGPAGGAAKAGGAVSREAMRSRK
jgi:hypothetical protein